jgi:hypothetical protein
VAQDTGPREIDMLALGRLSDRDIAVVLTCIRTDPEYKNSSFPVTPELVAEVRAAYGARSDPWSQAELEAIHGPVTGDWQPAEAPAAEASSDAEGMPEAAQADG